MNERGKPNSKMIILAAVLVLSLAANAILAVMLAKEKKDPYEPEYTTGEENPFTNIPEEQTDVAQIEVATAYITFAFPEEIENKIAVSTINNGDSTELTFTAKAYEQELILFSVSLAKTKPDGYILGMLNDKTEGEVYVAVNVNEQDPEDWSEAQYKEICTLQDYVNYIMIQVQKDPRFVPNR